MFRGGTTLRQGQLSPDAVDVPDSKAGQKIKTAISPLLREISVICHLTQSRGEDRTTGRREEKKGRGEEKRRIAPRFVVLEPPSLMHGNMAKSERQFMAAHSNQNSAASVVYVARRWTPINGLYVRVCPHRVASTFRTT